MYQPHYRVVDASLIPSLYPKDQLSRLKFLYFPVLTEDGFANGGVSDGEYHHTFVERQANLLIC